MENMFKIGDIICDCPESTWENQRFVITNFFGGSSWRMVATHKLDSKTEVNLVLANIRLVDAPKRPFLCTNMIKLLKLVTRGVVEARRELKIRNNIKKIKNGK